jgi:hypothetical protein
MEQTQDIWTLLEQNAPDGCDDVQDLYSWSLNYDAGRGPFTLFLDLTGWSQDNYGETFYNLSEMSLGYVELDKLARALSEYALNPRSVERYVDTLMEAESR